MQNHSLFSAGQFRALHERMAASFRTSKPPLKLSSITRDPPWTFSNSSGPLVSNHAHPLFYGQGSAKTPKHLEALVICQRLVYGIY